MKHSTCILISLLALLPLSSSVKQAHAQQDMPGMKMNMTDAPQPQTRKPASPNRERQRPDVMPADMKGMGHDQRDRRAKAAAQSVANSIQQQADQPIGKPVDDSDEHSITVPFQEVQEPEAIELRTGSDEPTPELLGDVVKRDPMTLANFIALAEKDNPTLRQAQLDAARSRAQGKQASLLPDPVIGYSGDHIRGGSYHGGEEGVFFSQEVLLGRKLALRRDAFRAEGHANDLAVEVQRARVHNDVTKAFFDALSAQASVAVTDRLLKVALDNETNSHERERVGEADAGDVLKAEVAAEQAQLDFASAQHMFLASFHQLATLAGQPSLVVSPLLGSLTQPPVLDTEAIVRRDIESSPEVQQAQAMLSAQQARVQSAKRESVPNLEVTAGEWNSGEDLNGTSGKRAGWMSFAQLGLVIPLWNRNQGNVAAAKALTERANADVVRTQLTTENRARPFAEQYEQARLTVERYRSEILPRARRAYELETMKYQQMAQSYPPVLDAQRMLFELQLRYINALHDEWTAATELQNFALAGALDRPMTAGSDDTMSHVPGSGGGN